MPRVWSGLLYSRSNAPTCQTSPTPAGACSDNRAAELKMAQGQSSCCSVSHLCHNHQCFNTQNLIVDLKSDNRKRKASKGNTI
ncbi:uncharacterized protein V1513DRAFT_464214 [Lipomyces chichibuensis]|uniref:uncharacterized protein n=1 Tax=Lipomyces chichibuensis TaxID=1546026 RepID=UPI003343A40F